MLSKPGRGAGLALMFAAASSMAPDAFGQGNTFNPYGNSGYNDYREFTQPMYSNEPSLPGQARLQGGGLAGSTSRANQFGSYSESLDPASTTNAPTSLRGRPGVPYYRAYRQYDSDYKRVYTPNSDADRKFGDRLKERDLAYDRAIEEKDPAKRAAMLRKLSQDSLDRPLPLASDASRGTAKRPAAAKSAKSAVPSAIPTPPARSGQTRSEAARFGPQPPSGRSIPSAGRATPSPLTRPSTPAPRAAAPAATPAASQPAPAETTSVDPGSVPIPPPPR